MSNINYILTNVPFNIHCFIEEASAKFTDVEFQQRGEDLCYLWAKNKSTRGIDVSIENGMIELRNTVLSNKADFQLTNIIAGYICEVFDGTLYIELEEKDSGDMDSDDLESALELVPKTLPVYSESQIVQMQLEDTKTLRSVITQLQKHVTIFGPQRRTHFGVYFMENAKSKSIEELTEEMHQCIINVNYNLPDYSYGDILEMGDIENKKTLKLVSNTSHCIIDKYDYLLIEKNDNELIAITNDALNTILPHSWSRVDEFTIVAPILSGEDFEALVAKAAKHNQYNQLMSIGK